MLRLPSGKTLFTILFALLTVCAAGCTLLAFLGRWHWFLDLFAHFRPQYLIVLTISAAALISLRNLFLAGIAATAASLNALAVIPHILPLASSAPIPSQRPVLRCVSINLLQGNQEHDKVIRLLRERPLDFVVLQEVTPVWATVLSSLRDLYPFQFVRARKDSKGAAVLSRSPTNRSGFEPLTTGGQIGLVYADVDWAGQPLTVYGVHSHKPTKKKDASTQKVCFDWIADRFARDRPRRAVIILGDFNSSPWSLPYQRFREAPFLVDTSQGRIFDATWNVWSSQRLLIDHCFLSPHWRLLKRETGPAIGSDHRPLLIEVALAR